MESRNPVSSPSSNLGLTSLTDVLSKKANPDAQLDAFLSFLRRLSKDGSDHMQDNGKLHLPFFQNRNVFSRFSNEFNRLYLVRDMTSSNSFLRWWKSTVSAAKYADLLILLFAMSVRILDLRVKMLSFTHGQHMT